MIICVDFDGTLCEHKYPEIGEPNYLLISRLILWKKIGHQIILLTCRDNEPLQKAIEWCKEKGLEFDAINDDVEEVKNTFTDKSNKVYGDIYLDDRNVSISDFLKIKFLGEK